MLDVVELILVPAFLCPNLLWVFCIYILQNNVNDASVNVAYHFSTNSTCSSFWEKKKKKDYSYYKYMSQVTAVDIEGDIIKPYTPI